MRTSLTGLLLLFVFPQAPVLAQDSYAEFIKAYRRAVEYDDQKGIDRTIRSKPDWALIYFNELAWTHAARLTEETHKPVQIMKDAWKRTFGTETLDHYQRFVESRNEDDRIALIKAEKDEGDVYRLFQEGLDKKDRPTLEQARQNAESLANRFQQLGHAIRAAKMFSLTAEIISKYPGVTLEDRRDALIYRNSFVNMRDQWDWTKDTLYISQVAFIKAEKERLHDDEKQQAKRESEGYAENAVGVDTLVMPDAKEEVFELEFEAQKKPIDDLFWKGGTAPGQWMMVYLQNAGPSKVHYFTGQELYMVRPGSNEFGMTMSAILDPKKNPGQTVEVPTKKRASTVFLGPNETRPYAFWFYKAKSRGTMVALTHGDQPQDTSTSAYIYYKSASSWKTEINGETVVFYDDNTNGKLFEEDAYAYELKDRTRNVPEGVPMPAFDSMKIGKGPITAATAFAKIGDKWYHLRAQDEEFKVGIRPLNPEYFKTGTVQMKWKGPRPMKPRALVISGRGTFAGAHYNLASGDPIEIPAGTYTISFGRISVGKDERSTHTQIFHGDMEAIDVGPGKTVTLELGAPFKLDCAVARSGQDITIDATSIQVKGRAGELYGRCTLPPAPEVIVNKKPGRGGKAIAEFATLTLDSYLKARDGKYADVSVDLLYFCMPKGDIKGEFELKATLPFKDAYVGLQQKKHKLFGKLEPLWKGPESTSDEGGAPPR